MMKVPTKVCRVCRQEKELFHFGRYTVKGKSHLKTQCKDCEKKAKKKTLLEKLRENHQLGGVLGWMGGNY